MTLGSPLLDTNCLWAAKKASADMSVTASKCTALVVKQMKRAMYVGFD